MLQYRHLTIVVFLLGVFLSSLNVLALDGNHSSENFANTSKDIKSLLVPLSKESPDYSPLIQWIDNKPYVLVGDATHGSHEFYQSRIAITKQLINQKGFNTIVIEGNWPATYRLNRFILGKTDLTSQQILAGYKNSSPWLWNNQEMSEFITWLRDYNHNHNKKVNIYGMDIYSLYESIDEVLDYVKQYYPHKLETAFKNMACFKKVAKNADDFLIKSRQPVKIACDEQARNLYHLIKAINLIKATNEEKEAYFNAMMNASVIDAAAFFFRLTGQPNPFNTWNLREYFMLGQINQIIEHQIQKHDKAKIIVWAHNSHVGNSSATERIIKGEVSLGNLFRQYLGEENVYLVGHLTNQGQVIASNQWNGEAYCMPLPPAKANSYGSFFKQYNELDFILQLTENPSLKEHLNTYQQQRMVGVVYNPLLDSYKNYLFADIKQQFDAVIFFNTTTALKPLYPFYRCH